MRFINVSQSRGSILVTVVLLISAAITLPGAALSVAQESSGQVKYSTRSFPAKIALAKIEADGHSPSEARQLLQDRLLKRHAWSNQTNSTEIVPSAHLRNDQLYVHGSLEYIDLINQQLINIQQFGLKQLLYTMLVVEVPTEEAKAIVEKWSLVGSSTSTTQKANSGKLLKNAVVPASFNASTTAYECRISDGLSEEQIIELVGLGKLIHAPTVVGENGAEVNVRVGGDVQFVAAYEPGKDENGNDSATMQPVIGTIHDGIKLGLTGAFDDKKENVRLDFRFTDTQFKGMGEPFTYEAKNGRLTVQQPEFISTEIQTSCKAPTNKTIALCSGRIIRESVVDQRVSLIRRIPYVGKLFKNTAKVTESTSTIILIQCQEQNAARPLLLNNPLD